MRATLLVAALAPFVMAGVFMACGGKRATPGPAVLLPDDVAIDTRVAEVSRPEIGDPPIDAAPEVTIDSNATTDGADAIAPEVATDAPVDGLEDVIDAPETPPPVMGTCADAAVSAAETGGCGAVVQEWPHEGEAHVDLATPIRYCTQPPHSGPHYPFWAAYQTYKKPVKYGYLVHALEHGGVIVLYKCASSCPDIEKALQAVIDARPVDPICDVDAGLKRRLILMPDPTLDVAVGAAAWHWTYRATCVDADSLGAFIDAHYAKGPENTCADGVAELP